METDFIFRNKFKYKNIKNCNNIIKFKTIFHFILLLLGIILIIFIVFNNIVNRKLLKQILINVNKNKNDIGLFNIKNKEEVIKNRINLLKIITNNNPYIYKHIEDCLLNDQDKLFCFYYLIYPKKVIGKNKILLGEKSDGCYVLLDDFKKIKIAYSFGISNMIQFDDELAKRGIDVYMYDHTINSLPHNNPKFHWSKIGICGNNERTQNLKTLEDLIKENGHFSEKNMILKIDVEDSEWNSLNDLNEDILRQFKYIAIEYHFFEPSKEEFYYNVLKKVHKSHQAFYCRCNDRDRIPPLRNRICKSLEISYIIREGNKFDKDDSIYPIFELDYIGPQKNNKSEYNLNILKLFDFDE
jgi:hypothetical protein